ncbi:hypothetical protein SLEP1_g35817 [Rubroshorea leprosula]|uniref:Uncharacterized protein n=1 Tax=Rubroshorea leprosula TaxID=152421 RepID=A0AAV5KPH8_9ROSI|nr:hypothetical protein SLEP1_g35817 [Rubroshorea leprosula]
MTSQDEDNLATRQLLAFVSFSSPNWKQTYLSNLGICSNALWSLGVYPPSSKYKSGIEMFYLFQGLIPRAKLLLSLGGTFSLAFGPLILLTVAFFSALYLYFGSSFVHDASNKPISPPQYIDPYALLEDERISQTAPRMN